jgi:hypothetical protein
MGCPVTVVTYVEPLKVRLTGGIVNNISEFTPVTSHWFRIHIVCLHNFTGGKVMNKRQNAGRFRHGNPSIIVRIPLVFLMALIWILSSNTISYGKTPSYYELLDVPENASTETVNAAYQKELAKYQSQRRHSR